MARDIDRNGQENRTREILRKVRQIEFRTRRDVSDALSGAYKSVFKGTGIDFEEVREYQPGDDIRSIDWNVTAKMDRPFVKLFREERELTIVLVVDLSASGNFASAEESKRERAAELASVLAFSAIRNNDKVGLFLFTSDVELFIPPKKGRQHVLRIIREILFFEPQKSGTDIPHALDQVNHLIRRKAIVFLISDFIDGDGGNTGSDGGRTGLSRSLQISSRRHDLICVEVADPREWELPNAGIIVLEDSETGEIVEIDTTRRSVREEYRNENIQRRQKLMEQFRRAGIDALSVATDQPYLSELQKFFAKREARRR